MSRAEREDDLNMPGLGCPQRASDRRATVRLVLHDQNAPDLLMLMIIDIPSVEHEAERARVAHAGVWACTYGRMR